MPINLAPSIFISTVLTICTVPGYLLHVGKYAPWKSWGYSVGIPNPCNAFLRISPGGKLFWKGLSLFPHCYLICLLRSPSVLNSCSHPSFGHNFIALSAHRYCWLDSGDCFRRFLVAFSISSSITSWQYK